jgi:hypothetical protein
MKMKSYNMTDLDYLKQQAFRVENLTFGEIVEPIYLYTEQGLRQAIAMLVDEDDTKATKTEKV